MRIYTIRTTLTTVLYYGADCDSDSKISDCAIRCLSTVWTDLEPELDSKNGWISSQPELDISYIPNCSIDTMWAFWSTCI